MRDAFMTRLTSAGTERARLIKLADELDVPVRAVVFDGDTQPGPQISITQLALCVLSPSARR